MRLRELLKFDEIVVQCHDNPDADAIGSGYALYCYLIDHGKKVSLIYGGNGRIRKSNLMLMIQMLQIPIKYCDSMEAPELLVTVDCRYGEGNVTHFPARNIAVIDHHRVNGALPELSEVRSNLGSCSTLLWEMLKQEGYDVNANKNLATAMYYGLYTDTNELVEISHPLDMDLRDEAEFNVAAITRFRNSNLSLEELDIAGAALLRSDYNEDYRFAVVKANACDPNILGIISDLVLAVDSVDNCLVFCVTEVGVKISVRSCIREVKASEMAQAICEGIGSGGGHFVKAGGRINLDLLTREYLKYCEETGLTPRMEVLDDGTSNRPTISAIKFFLETRMREYYDNTEIIYFDHYNWKEDDLREFVQKPQELGFLQLDTMYGVGDSLLIRTMKGDMELTVEPGQVLLIGVDGQITVMKGNDFTSQYLTLQESFRLDDVEYAPTIKNKQDNRIVPLLNQARVCISKQEEHVMARQLTQKTKLFTLAGEDNYLMGKIGDYLVIRAENPQDMNIIKKDMFESYYVVK